jgi:hypothetical protein
MINVRGLALLKLKHLQMQCFVKKRKKSMSKEREKKNKKNGLA